MAHDDRTPAPANRGGIRTLSRLARAARNQGLEVIPTLMAEVLLECPACKQAGAYSLACVEINQNTPSARCATCTSWGDDPYEILRILGHNEDASEPHEIPLRVFDLLWALHRAAP